MAKKATTTSAVKFVKGGFYEDAKGHLWHCAHPKLKKTPDGHSVVLMQRTEDGVPVGEAGEEYTDTFVKQLTKAELKEYREAARREKEAEEDAQGGQTAGQTTEIVSEKPAKAKKEKAKREGKLSCLDAAAQVLVEAKEPMAAKEMIEAMAAKGLWTSPGGSTPHATLYAAIIREIAKMGGEARFVKQDRGRFAAANGMATPAADAEPTTAKAKKPRGRNANA